jgi:alpha-L-rhamnosidase
MLDQPSMNSYNHYAYGAVADWIYRYAAGIDTAPTDAGFHTIVLHPTFDARLGHLNFSYESAYGAIESNWSVTGNTTTWHVTIPPNTTGQLLLRRDELDHWKMDDKPLPESVRIKSELTEAGAMNTLPAGSYNFTVQVPASGLTK